MRRSVRQPPFVFYLPAALVTGLCLGLMLAMVLHLPAGVAWTPLARGAALLGLALGAAAGEALWRVRPWAYPATVLAYVYTAATVAISSLGWGFPEPGVALPWLAAISVLLVMPLLRRLRDRSRRLWPAGPSVPGAP